MIDQIKYRADIDGLRAVAVLSVVLYHAGVDQLSGGFVGVDIFFVISGYLITRIILEDIRKDSFSVFEFYERRIKRIFPALFVVMFATTIIAVMLLLPNDLMAYARSFLSASLSVSNILFWQESGYFSYASELKPLLHTWSLAVEEQFYIIFPIFMLIAFRWAKNYWIYCILFFVLSSLVLSLILVDVAPSAAFFLAPTRLWELALGTLLTLELPNLKRNWQYELLSVTGMGLIIGRVIPPISSGAQK